VPTVTWRPCVWHRVVLLTILFVVIPMYQSSNGRGADEWTTLYKPLVTPLL
jgi:hypothetical protein